MPQRTGDGAYRRRLCQDEKPAWRMCLYFLDRARRNEHDYGRRAGDNQPAPCAASPRRHLRKAQRRARAAATRMRNQPGRLGQRLLQARFPLLGPNQSPRPACVGIAGKHATLVSPDKTGAVTLALPQDVQTESYDYPLELFQKRVWTVPRNRPDRASIDEAAKLVRAAKRPMIIAGGGVIYSEATGTLAEFCKATGIPVGETQAGKGSLHCDHPQNLGGIGATGSLAANRIAAEADLVLGIGTRYSDFTTASKTAFRNPAVRFININVAELDSHKHCAVS